MKIRLNKAQWQKMGARAGWMKTAGEDWEINDNVKRLTDEVIAEIENRNGRASKTQDNAINAEKFPVDSTHLLPLKIHLYEGTYYPGKVLINASFEAHGNQHPVPVKDRTDFSAAAVIEAVAQGFMYLVRLGPSRR